MTKLKRNSFTARLGSEVGHAWRPTCTNESTSCSRQTGCELKKNISTVDLLLHSGASIPECITAEFKRKASLLESEARTSQVKAAPRAKSFCRYIFGVHALCVGCVRSLVDRASSF